MTRVKIDTPGVTVELDGDGSVHELSREALRLFRKAGGWPQGVEGPAYGFAVEKRTTPPAQPSAMRWAPGPYREQGFGQSEDPHDVG